MSTGLCAFVGDEVSAAGFRLAGIDTHVPAAHDTVALFRRLVREVQLLLITAEAANSLPAAELQRAMAAERPLVLVIPDVRGRLEPADVGIRLRRQLGMAE
jgi:vacuolar-type H+-ATPase subunit F/Vma7